MEKDPVVRAFERLLARAPEAPLIVGASRQATRSHVDALASSIADRVGDAGLGSGDLVALSAANGPGFLGALLALRRRRAAVLLVDHQTPAAETRRIGETLGVAAWLQVARRWPESSDVQIALGARPRKVAPEAAVVKLTSGSTGTPRGILATAEAIVADDRALAATMGLVADDVILGAVPMSHSYGLSSVVLPALVRGSRVVVPDRGGPLAAMRAAAAAGVTFLPTVPAYLRALLKLSKPPAWPPTLRLLITAGAPLPPATARAVRELYGRSVRVFYGASECGGITFDREGDAGERGTLGTPVDGVKVELEAVEGGASGEGVVTVRSAAVALGYLPEPDPRLADGRFVTADLAAFEGGELKLRGRIDDWINIKGKKVNPRELESVLEELAGVEAVAVVGVPVEGGGQTVRAVLACPGGNAPDLEGVRSWCRRRLAEHKLPRSLVIVDELPRTPRGKLDRRVLARLRTGE